MAERSDEEVGGEERSRGGGRVTIDRPAYDELQFEENLHPLGYQRLKVTRLNSYQGTNVHNLYMACAVQEKCARPFLSRLGCMCHKSLP